MALFAIGDIHGHIQSLEALLATHQFSQEDSVVFLGDYVDKGPDVAGTLDMLVKLSDHSNFIFLRGNHDQPSIPDSHIHFLRDRCQDYYEDDEFILVHGGIQQHLAPADDDIDHLYWLTLSMAAPHFSGRTVVCGHSSQMSGRIVDLGHTICIDTGITKGGAITCLNLSDFSCSA